MITGVGSGIGWATETRFAAEGARIVAADWNAQRMDEIVASLKRSGGTAVGAQGNIAETMPQDRLDPEGAARAGTYAAPSPVFLQLDDIAQVALFLASNESVHINGAIIPANAGWTAA